MQLADFVGRKHSGRWGAMHYRRSLAEILGKEEAEAWKRKWREQYWSEIKRWREQAQAYREHLEEALGFTSRWKGELVYRRLPGGAVGAKEWRCTIALDEDFWQSATEEQKRHVLIHEMLHSLSPGLTPSAYRLHRGWEEGVVERLSYLFYRRMHHEADGWATGYAHYIEALEGARRALEMPEDDFYLWLFQVPLPSRGTALFRKAEVQT